MASFKRIFFTILFVMSVGCDSSKDKSDEDAFVDSSTEQLLNDSGTSTPSVFDTTMSSDTLSDIQTDSSAHVVDTGIDTYTDSISGATDIGTDSTPHTVDSSNDTYTDSISGATDTHSSIDDTGSSVDTMGDTGTGIADTGSIAPIDTESETATVLDSDTRTDGGDSTLFDISVQYTMGSNTSPSIVYAIWVENYDANFIRPIYICKRLTDGSLTGTALPYWSVTRLNRADASEVDAVTGATVGNADFTVTETVSIPALSNITVYVEVDHSFDNNDWFDNQPAILYATSFNLPVSQKNQSLSFIGWTPNELTRNVIPNTPMGVLQSETRYITHHKEGSGFGDADDRSSTHMVGQLKATVKEH
ncbi:MAG: hypothetical protein JXR76_29475 [Deltaproteobacteria bacterium]|nr:hypothetical protein [Deltaproteobacteria bacterium]